MGMSITYVYPLGALVASLRHACSEWEASFSETTVPGNGDPTSYRQR